MLPVQDAIYAVQPTPPVQLLNALEKVLKSTRTVTFRLSIQPHRGHPTPGYAFEILNNAGELLNVAIQKTLGSVAIGDRPARDTQQYVTIASTLGNTVSATIKFRVVERIHLLGPLRAPMAEIPAEAKENFQPDATDLVNALYYHVNRRTTEFLKLQEWYGLVFPGSELLVAPILPGQNSPNRARPPQAPNLPQNQVRIEIREEGNIEPVPWGAMSSGMKEALAILARIALAPSGSFIAIEEPEIHFNADSLRKVLDLIFKESRHKQFLLVSHAPDLLEYQKIDDDRFWIVERPSGRETTVRRSIGGGDIDTIERLLHGRPRGEAEETRQEEPTSHPSGV